MIVLLLMTSSVALTLAADPPGGYYTTRYDHLDVENILNQKRLVYYYTECLLDRGPCTPQGIEFKRILPEALRTNCLRCTEKQRFVTMKTIRRLKKEYPEVWSQLAEIWDPTGAYYNNLEESVSKKYNRSPEITPEPLPLVNDASNVQKIAPTIANRFADKPISFSPTTAKIIETTTVARSTTQPTTKQTTQATTATTTTTTTTTTKRPNRIEHSTKRLIYNYDFSATSTPPVQKQTGLNIVLRGVNNIIAPISDIAGKVINAGSDFAGMVLNVLGVRRITV